jgi:hypothetical protein
MAKLWTIGEIARQAGQPLHRVEYLVRARNIAPIGRAGRLRVFSEETSREIVAELCGTSREVGYLPPENPEKGG